MKKLLLLILISFCLSAQAATKLIIVERQTDADGVYASVMIFGNADGSYIQKKVTTAAFLAKLATISNKTITGFAKNSDRIIIRFDASVAVESVEFHVTTTSNTETFRSVIIHRSNLSSQTITDVAAVKTATEDLP